MRYLLGIDLGAGSLKATLVDETGHLQAEASEPVTTFHPAPGQAEQNPAQWRTAMGLAVRSALAAAKVETGAVIGVGISAGAHIPVLLDAKNEVIRPAIMWSDMRSTAEAQNLHAKAGALITRTSLNRVNPTWTLAMLAWLQTHEPASIARTARLMLAKDYLRFCLTNTWESDYSDAIGALMADDATKNWSAEICALIGWNISTLPPLRAATDVVGTISEAGAALTGLAPGTQIVCGANDTTAELFGVGAVQPGMGALKLATAGVLYLTTQGPRVHPPVSCYPHIVNGLYYTATGTNSCASAHRWLRDIMFAQGGFVEMDQLAATIAPGANGLLFHPYLQGERAPYWDPDLRADFIGLTINHGRAHFARALYEGIAFSLCDVLRAAQALGLEYGTLRLMGGGARSATWRQIIADVTGLEVEIMENTDASFGAALLAGIGTGIFTSPHDAVARCVRLAGTCTPHAARHEIYSNLFEIYKESQINLAETAHKLKRLSL